MIYATFLQNSAMFWLKNGKLKFLVILNPISREKPIAISEYPEKSA